MSANTNSQAAQDLELPQGGDDQAGKPQNAEWLKMRDSVKKHLEDHASSTLGILDKALGGGK